MAEFRLLGPLEVRSGGELLDVGAPKQRLLLSLLLLRANDVVSRETAVDCLWGEAPPAKVESALQVYVHHLRRVVGRDRIVTHGTGYLLRAEVEEIDAQAFDRRLSDARAALSAGDDGRARTLLDEALELWRGEPLSALPFVPFVAVERERLEERRLVAEELRFEARLALGEHSALVPELSAFVGQHTFRERASAQLMLALYRAGRQADALETYRRTRERLDDELGIEPSPQLRELERAILRHDPSLDLVRTPEQPSRYVLPRPATALVGRRLEIAAVSTTFETGGARLLTLLGPGGVGKTRLALAVAEELGAKSRDGAAFVGLASLGDAALVPSAVATALGVASEGEAVVEALIASLAQRDLFLVLDNFEHVVEAAPAVAQLLAGAPALSVLVTSRTPLRLSGEHLYDVPPLEVPRPDLRFEELARNQSVAVFLARARAVDRSFELTEADAPYVAEICRLLDGMPLAIELAAARTKLLTPQQIVQRISRPLELLTGGDRDLPTRHQTLRATIEWSYELLEPAQRTLFERLSVFPGSCSLDAVDTVCEGDLDSLTALLDHSLVRREQGRGHEPRFRMLATIADYADERLADDERAALRRRHALYYLALAEETRETIAGSGAREAELLAALERDHNHYRAALRWAEEQGDSSTLLRLVTALRVFWMVRGHLAEGRAWFETALSSPGAARNEYRAAALSAGGTLVYRTGDDELARRWWEEAQDLFEQAGDVSSSARTRGHLAGIALAEGDLDRATELWEESARELRELGDEMRLAIALGNLGFAASSKGRYDEAVVLHEEALELARRVQNWITEGSILFNLGRATFELGDVDTGRRLIQDALRMADRLGYGELVANCLLGLADIAAAEGDEAHARRLLAACDQLTAALGIRFQADEVAIRERAAARSCYDAVSEAREEVDVDAAVAAELA